MEAASVDSSVVSGGVLPPYKLDNLGYHILGLTPFENYPVFV